MGPRKVCSHIEAPNIKIATEELPRMQSYIKQIKPGSVIRRFVVDCHNGMQYWNNEFNQIHVNGIPESDADILTYLRKECFEHHGNKIYCCTEITNSSISMTQLRGEKLTPELEAKLRQDMRIVFYAPQWEPLNAYRYMI